LARIVQHFGDLLFGEDLQVEDRVDVARLVHGPAERRQMQEVGVFQAAHHDPDGGDAAENRRAGFALRLVFERKLVADVDVRIEDSRQHDLAAGVEHVLRRCGKLLADGGNAAAADADIRRHRADAGNDERAVADDEIEARAHGRLMLSGRRAVMPRLRSRTSGITKCGASRHAASIRPPESLRAHVCSCAPDHRIGAA
jgi:hypothetical protein